MCIDVVVGHQCVVVVVNKALILFFKKNAGYIQELLNLSELVLFTAHHYQLHMHATMQNK
jgi:hypothetical protein